jgi:hypothetical protein
MELRDFVVCSIIQAWISYTQHWQRTNTDIPVPSIRPLSKGVTCDSKSRVTALTQNHPFGTLETPIANGNNVAHNLVTT